MPLHLCKDLIRELLLRLSAKSLYAFAFLNQDISLVVSAERVTDIHRRRLRKIDETRDFLSCVRIKSYLPNGQKEGEDAYTFPDGAYWIRCYRKNGLLHGLKEKYRDGGAQYYRCLYLNDEKVGMESEW